MNNFETVKEINRLVKNNPVKVKWLTIKEVQKLTTLSYSTIRRAGHHALKWNATNDYGDPVGAGVYFYQIQTRDFVKTRKMVLLK